MKQEDEQNERKRRLCNLDNYNNDSDIDNNHIKLHQKTDRPTDSRPPLFRFIHKDRIARHFSILIGKTKEKKD